MMWNSGRVSLGLSAVTSAPGSTFRAVMTPAKGGDDLLERLQVHVLLDCRLVDLDVRPGGFDLGGRSSYLGPVLVDAAAASVTATTSRFVALSRL